jgi:hypothetical protein
MQFNEIFEVYFFHTKNSSKGHEAQSINMKNKRMKGIDENKKKKSSSFESSKKQNRKTKDVVVESSKT